MNNIIISGRLTKDLEKLPTETPAVKGCIAVNRDYQNKNGEYDTDFIDFIINGEYGLRKLESLKQGDLIAIKGALRTGKYTNQKNETIRTFHVSVSAVECLVHKNPATMPTPQPIPTPEREYEIDEDDLPF